MRLTEISYKGPPPIDAYGPGFFRLNSAVHQGGLGILGRDIFSWNGLQDFSIFITQKADFDVLFIGVGATITPLSAGPRTVLEAKDIPFEVMSTASACRTYNVLLSEGRRVAAALLPV